MSSSTIDYLNNLSKQLNIYLSSFFYIFGNISTSLCLLMFISMKRFRKNPSSTYLLSSSLSGFVLINTSYLTRVFLPNFIFDPSTTSLIWCKLRQYIGHLSSLIFLYCISWAMMDQYLSTSKKVRLRQFSTVKIARRLVSLTFLFSFIHSIPLIIYNEINMSTITNIRSCVITNNLIYRNYVTYFVIPFVLGIFPTFLMIIFAILSYANINYLHQRQMRTQVQHQLTRMVSAQTFFVIIGMIAYTAQTIYNLVTTSTLKSPPFVLGIFPTFLMIIFAILSYANINYLHQRQMRTQVQHQLTRMVSAQTFFVIIGMIAYTAQTIYNLVTTSTLKSPLRQAQENVALTITGVLAYTGYVFNFYIYIFVSPTLRKHFKELIQKFLYYCTCHFIRNNRTQPTHITQNNLQLDGK
ncbi:unnamed protein product [Adineta steineri]|uniref:G-protein coupled receptors family 1 profile domain-containing protein n=1 Tax=Adineta steineri TaxID=433720 RepID=A0A814JNK1_9BILA|nr:unnamed protein product [Adineta steineri]